MIRLKKLDTQFDKADNKSTFYTDALADILMDALVNYMPLELERLHKWHMPFSLIRQELLKYGCLYQVEGALGRNIKYEIANETGKK